MRKLKKNHNSYFPVGSHMYTLGVLNCLKDQKRTRAFRETFFYSGIAFFCLVSVFLFILLNYGKIEILLLWNSAIETNKKTVIWGVFSVAEYSHQRHIIREAMQHMNKSKLKIDFELYFVIGRSNISDNIINEQTKYQDLIILDIEENMNKGKTLEWFSRAIRIAPGRNTIIYKVDQDLFTCLNLIDKLWEKWNFLKFLYVGRDNAHSCGGWNHCPPISCSDFKGECWTYMSGGIYGLSYSLVEAILWNGAKSKSSWHEDVQTALWVRGLKTSTRDRILIYSNENGEYWCHNSQDSWARYRSSGDCNSELNKTVCTKR